MNKESLQIFIDIYKGSKLSNISDSKVKNCKRYIQIDDLRNDNNLKYTTDVGVEATTNDLIIAWDGANAGTIGYGLEGMIGSTLAVLKLKKDNINPSYLGRFLQSQFKYIRNNCTGATIPHVSRNYLLNIKVPLPPLPEQKRIAAILDKADALRQKRRESLHLLDEFLRATFLEMFGDLNGEISLSELCLINPSKKEILEMPQETKVTFLPMASVSEEGEILDRQTRQLMDVKNGFTYFKENDVLFAKITPCMENGKGTIATNLTNGIGFGSTEFHVLRPSKEITSSWLFSLLSWKIVRNYAEKNMTGTAGQKRVPKSFFNILKVNKPQKSELIKYDTVFKNIIDLKSKQKSNLQYLDTLFNSLVQKAFRGEL